MHKIVSPTRHIELLELFLKQGTTHALVLLDEQGHVVGWFAGAERIFGYTADEIVGQPLSQIFTPEDVERGIPELEMDVAQRDGIAQDDRWQLRKDGGRFWAAGAMVALRSPDGNVLGYAKVLHNRTDQKTHVESLENRVAGLVKADERKNLFLATLAHELRNPLAPLTSAVELIKLAAPESHELELPLTLISRQVEFIQRLVGDLLDATRIAADKVRLQRQSVDLNQLLRQVGEHCRSDIDRRRQDFKLLLTNIPIVVQGDAVRLSQVFVNLVTNASKYTEPGGNIWVVVSVEGNETVTRVKDDGLGISAEMLPRIFDLFTQEESARLKAPGGLGIGLSLVKQLVSMHGGTVQVRSDGRDKGSEFIVRLPLAAPTSVGPQENSPAAIPPPQ